MKITQNNDTLLINNSLVPGAIAGGVVSLAGLAMLAFGLIQHGGKNFELIGGAILLIGLIVLAFDSAIRAEIIRGGQTIITKKRLLGGNTPGQSFATADIASVYLSTRIDWQNATPDSSPADNRVSDLVLFLKDNTQVTLGEARGNNFSINGLSLGMLSAAPLSKQARQIAEFLGVPLNTSYMTTPQGIVQSVVSGGQSPTPPASTPTTVSPQPGAQAAPAATQSAPAPTDTPQAGPSEQS